MGEILIETKNLCKKFKGARTDKIVLDNLDLKVYQGEMLSIRGKSGNGKSTLLNILAATMKADKGEVIFKNCDLQKLSNRERANYRRENISYIPQNLYLLNDRNVFMNIALPLTYQKEDRRKIREKVEEMASYFEIDSLLYNSTKDLSRGEKQRVAICRAVVKNSELIIADEPTGSLDEENERIVMQMFRILKKKGKTIIIATHDDSVSNMCDDVYSIGINNRIK